jgi:hypothetical protein
MFQFVAVDYCSSLDHYINKNMENHPGNKFYRKRGMGRPWLTN